MMKVKLTKTLSALALGFLSLGLVSCDPEKPQDERKNKLHENPHRAVYTLIEGTLDEGVFNGKPSLTDVKVVEGSEQKISFSETKEKGWAVETGSKNTEFKVKSIKESPNTVYILKIDYYSPSGAHMNHQFIDNGQDRIHQHFFSVYKNGLLVRSNKNLPYNYRYADTTPWNKEDGQLTGPDNPIGFKGIIRFTQDDLRFNLNADLLHGFVPKNQFGVEPFYAPSAKLRSNSDMDISLKLPIVIDNGGKNFDEPTKGDTPKEPEKPNQPEGPVTGKLNKTKATKIKIKMYEGHLHSATSFHYVPGPSGFKIPNMKFEKEITLEYRGDKWVVAEGDMTWLLLVELNPAAIKGPGALPAPVYGMWIQYFDKNNREITEEFAGKDEYQHFFTLTDVEALPLGKPMTEDDKKTEKLMHHTYRDTTPFNKSGEKEGATFHNDKQSVGLKGIFYFHRSRMKFNLQIDLWDTKGHKVDPKTGKASVYHTPSEDLRKHGEHVISLSIPVYMPGDNHFYEAISDLAYTEEEVEDVKMEQFDEINQKTAKYFMEQFKVTWEQLRMDLYVRIWGKRGEEKKGVWF